MRFPQSNPECQGCWLSSLGFSPLKKAEAQGTPLCVVLAWWGVIWSTCSCFSYPSNAVCLGLLVQGQGASASHPCSRILSGFLSLNSWLVILVRGLEVRNSLCCHLGDVTLQLHLSFNPILHVWLNLKKKLSKFHMERPCKLLCYFNTQMPLWKWHEITVQQCCFPKFLKFLLQWFHVTFIKQKLNRSSSGMIKFK